MQQWIRAAKAGDEQAWNFLYNQYYPGLYSIALGICGNVQEAKDAVQDSFVMAWLKLEKLENNAAFGGWLKKILTRTCYHSFHKKSLPPIPTALAGTSPGEEEINQKLEQADTLHRLYTTLAHLPETLHSTLLLRYFSGFRSYDEIAIILGIPVGTVRSRLSQAKAKLAGLWQQAGDPCSNILKRNEEWNAFYHSTFMALHHHDSYKRRFMDHLQKDLFIMFDKKKTGHGSRLIDHEIHEDRRFGSWFEPINIFSSGNISIVEVKHFNSPEHPDHCPSGSVFVLYRDKAKIDRMHFHHASV